MVGKEISIDPVPCYVYVLQLPCITRGASANASVITKVLLARKSTGPPSR